MNKSPMLERIEAEQSDTTMLDLAIETGTLVMLIGILLLLWSVA
jgi:hypothetical protein